MTTLFHILSGPRLEVLLGMLALLWIYYSPDLRDMLGRIPLLRASMESRDAKHLKTLAELHGNAYRLLVVLGQRLTASLLYGAAVSVAVVVLHNVAGFLQLSIMDNTHVENLAAAIVLCGPMLGLVLFVFWTRSLLAELQEYDRALSTIRK